MSCRPICAHVAPRGWAAEDGAMHQTPWLEAYPGPSGAANVTVCGSSHHQHFKT